MFLNYPQWIRHRTGRFVHDFSSLESKYALFLLVQLERGGKDKGHGNLRYTRFTDSFLHLTLIRVCLVPGAGAENTVVQKIDKVFLLGSECSNRKTSLTLPLRQFNSNDNGHSLKAQLVPKPPGMDFFEIEVESGTGQDTGMVVTKKQEQTGATTKSGIRL